MDKKISFMAFVKDKNIISGAADEKSYNGEGFYNDPCDFVLPSESAKKFWNENKTSLVHNSAGYYTWKENSDKELILHGCKFIKRDANGVKAYEAASYEWNE